MRISMAFAAEHAPLDDHLDRVPRSGQVSAGAAAEGLAERAAEEVHVGSGHAQVLVRSAAGLAHHAGAVRVVDDEQGAVLVGEPPQLRELREVALHREHAVGDEPDHALVARLLPGLLEGLAGRAHVAVLVDPASDALLDRRAQPHAVDDAGVIQLVGDDHVARLAQRGEERLGGGPAGDERVGRLDPEEARDRLLHVQVRRERAADEPHRSGAGAVPPQPLDARLDDLGVVGQPEVVVRAEARDAATAAQIDGRVHRPVDRLQHLELAGLPEVIEDPAVALGEHVGAAEVGRGHDGSRLVVPVDDCTRPRERNRRPHSVQRSDRPRG
jgi:hypothetical protein